MMAINPKLTHVTISLFLLFDFLGCDSATPPSTPKVPTPPTASGYARFQTVGQGPGIALDTKTGMLCHTYNEHRDSYISAQDGPGLRNLPGHFGHPSYDSLPMCVDLSQHEHETVLKELAADSTVKPCSTSPAAQTAAEVNVQSGDFGARFPWYVDVVRRKTAQNWYKKEVDPSTPDGARVFLRFSVSRSGEPSGACIVQSSGSPTLDTSCVRAVQRVDTYGPLPPGYSGSSLQVSYYCEQSVH